MAGKKASGSPTVKRARRSRAHTVRGEANNLALASVGHALNLRVYRGDRLLGRLHIGQGGLNWIPKGKQASQGRHIPWEVFAVIMKEWPFGHSKRARLKFVDGAMLWRGPGRGGAGRKVTWDEFVHRMEMELPKGGKRPRVRPKPRPAPARKVHGPGEPPPKKPPDPPAPSQASGDETRRRPPKGGPEPPPGGGAAPPPDPVEVPGVRRTMREVRVVSYQAPNGDELFLNNPGSGKKEPTPVIVRMGGVELGTVDSRDRFQPVSHDRRLTRRIVGYMNEFLKDPGDWIYRYGQRTGRCAVCGRPMWRPESLARGIGPKCAQKIGYLGRGGAAARAAMMVHGPGEPPPRRRPTRRPRIASRPGASRLPSRPRARPRPHAH